MNRNKKEREKMKGPRECYREKNRENGASSNQHPSLEA